MLFVATSRRAASLRLFPDRFDGMGRVPGSFAASPVLFTCVALVACIIAALRVWRIRGRLRQLRLGRDGERCVAQFLERLRDGGGQVFHDIPAVGFNLDHVIISPHGIYAVETKTFSKPFPRAAITVEGDALLVAGRRPDRDPIEQAKSAARWLADLLEATTGKKFPARGVVVFPGWFVDNAGRAERCGRWSRRLRRLSSKRSRRSSHRAMSRLLRFITRYIRSEVEKAA
jgi:hypothetical protein